MRKAALLLPTVLLLLVGMTGCPKEAPVTQVPPVDEAPLPGCRVQWSEDGSQAVGHVLNSDAYVYRIDGDLATCKLEILYRPDEDSEEELLYSITGDSVLDIAEGESNVIDPHDYHHVLAIVVPDYPPKPDDEIMFSFAAQRKVSGGSTGSSEITEGASHRDSKKAEEIFPESLLAHTGPRGSVGGPAERCDVKPGQDVVIVDDQHHWRGRKESEGGTTTRRDIVRYRVTVTCLEDGKLPDRDGEVKKLDQ